MSKMFELIDRRLYEEGQCIVEGGDARPKVFDGSGLFLTHNEKELSPLALEAEVKRPQLTRYRTFRIDGSRLLVGPTFRISAVGTDDLAYAGVLSHVFDGRLWLQSAKGDQFFGWGPSWAVPIAGHGSQRLWEILDRNLTGYGLPHRAGCPDIHLLVSRGQSVDVVPHDPAKFEAWDSPEGFSRDLGRPVIEACRRLQGRRLRCSV